MPRIERELDRVQGIAEYVKKNIHKGYTIESLKWALINQGHSKVEIDKAISLATEQLEKESRKQQEQEQLRRQQFTEIMHEAPAEEEKKGFFKKIFNR